MRHQLLVTLSLISAFTFAAETKKTADTTRQMTISYGAPAWNGNSGKIDTGFLIVRDRASGKLMQIELEETEPDSSNFRGHFSLRLDSEQAQTDIFVPPQNLSDQKAYAQLLEDVQNNKLQRKPIVWKKNEKGQSLIDVFDTREQAEQALKVYQEESRLAQELKKKKLIKPVPSETALEAARQAERKAALEKLAADAAQRETERLRLEQIERQKAEERERMAKELSEQAKAERRAKAVKLAEDAMVLYDKGEYTASEKKFKEAVEFDPDNTSYYFKYGVTLYRNQKFNDALVILRRAKVSGRNELERKYYIGLTHYRLSELDPAVQAFNDVAAANEKDISPSALFYAGVVLYAQEKYTPAKKAFETVIDTSGDPRLDDQAEEYLDRIASAMIYQKLRENRWTVTGTVGLSYDSNVLLAPDNAADQGTSTDIADLRVLTVASVDYRPIFGPNHELNANLTANLTNSNLSNSESKKDAVKADPWVYDFALPYSYKGVIGKKGYKLTLKPTYEMLYMDPEQTGTKHIILGSYMVNVDNTLVMSNTWFSTYGLEWRMDDSKTADSIGTNDSDANKYTIKTVQSWFLDKAKKEALMPSLAYVINAAKGTNKKFNRIDAGVNYIRPGFWSASWIFGLAAYKLSYPNAEEKRDDLNLTVTAGLSKPVREWVTWGVTGSYTKNNSNLEAYKYSKYLVMTTATFTTNF